MRKRLALILMVFTALWLPLQSVAVMDMAVCEHGAGATAAAHADHHDADASPHGEDGAPSGLGGCGDCGVCHLACSGFVVMSDSRTPVIAAAHVLVGVARVLVDQTAPDGLRRPPRSAA